MGMRQVNVTKILVGLMLGFSARLFYEHFTGLSKHSGSSARITCSPCEDESKIRGDPCPICGPTSIVAEKEPDIVDAYKPKGMYEITRWYYFNEEYMYDIINGEPKVKLVGGWYEETRGVTQVALDYINSNKMLGKTWTLVGLQDGYLRTDVSRGTDYILDLEVKSVEKYESESTKTSFRVRMIHAYESKGKSLSILSQKDVPSVDIHFIVLVSGNEDRLEAFIQLYNEHRSNGDKLTLALFLGKGQFSEESISMKDKVEELIQNSPSNGITYVLVEGDYSILQAVKQATEKVRSEEIVVTLNIDMHFGKDFLQTCRLVAEPRKRAYFPTAFSQYDPEIIEKGMPPGKPRNINKMGINKFTGYWMYDTNDFICAYSSDLRPLVQRVLVSMNGMLETSPPFIDGGKNLYNAFLSDDIEIVSTVEPDLFRIFRQRRCDKRFMPLEEYNHCFQSAVKMLGSKPTLSILYLTEIARRKV